jgi:hypothetical protein
MISGDFVPSEFSKASIPGPVLDFWREAVRNQISTSAKTALVRYANAISIKSYEKIHHACGSSVSKCLAIRFTRREKIRASAVFGSFSVLRRGARLCLTDFSRVEL